MQIQGSGMHDLLWQEQGGTCLSEEYQMAMGVDYPIQRNII